MERIAIHYVILNWNEKAFTIIEQLHSDALAERRSIIFLLIMTSQFSFLRGHEYEVSLWLDGNRQPDWSKTGHVSKGKSVIITS